MILNERESRHEHVLHVARQMMTAARTAPKGKAARPERRRSAPSGGP